MLPHSKYKLLTFEQFIILAYQ